MLKNATQEINLISARDALFQKANYSLKMVIGQFKSGDIYPVRTSIVTRLNYPVLKYPEKVKVLLLDKTLSINGYLLGIKGQYLILDSGVINIRKYGGYEVECILT